MKLLFKQRFFSWLDSYDIFDETGAVIFRVEGKLSWGHKLHILDVTGQHIATVKEVIWTFLKPRFEVYLGDELLGTITKEFTFLKPKFTIDFNHWSVDGSFWEWDYSIRDGQGNAVAVISKELWNWTDTYAIDVADPADALGALLVTLAIDAEKCSRNN